MCVAGKNGADCYSKNGHAGINGNLRYSAERHTVIMYCEHPAKRFMNAGEWYDITMDLFRNFLKTEDGCNFING